MSQSEIEPWIQQIRTILTKMASPKGENDPETPPYYELGEELGHGGMGAVFLATLQPLGVLRALKVFRMPIRTIDDGDARKRFLLEARIMGNLRHPAVIKALDYQVYSLPNLEPIFIYAMEPCLVKKPELRRICADFQVPCTEELEKEQGKWHGSVSLQTFLTAGCVFPERTVARFARELIAVLRSAHEQKFKIGDELVKGIVHRDVKPSNILVGPDGRLRLTDFGISKPAASLPTTGTGTEDYAAPEQWKAIRVTKITDYYSLGVVLYQLLTRVLPKKPWQNWQNPSTLATGISPHWDILLRGMLRYVPKRRLADPDLLDYEFAEIEAGRGGIKSTKSKPIEFRKEPEEPRAQNRESWPVAEKEMVALGKCLERTDPAAAFGLYAAAAERGEKEGAFLAGKDYFYGIAHGIDATKAEYFLKKAAELSAPASIRADANDYLGLLAQQQKKNEAANNHFQEAKQAGSLDALDNLGLIDWRKAEECSDTAKQNEYYKTAFASFSEADQKARSQIAQSDSNERRRIDTDVAWARLHLARCLFQGKGVGKDPERAKKLLEEVGKVAVAVDDIYLKKDIGDQYLHGETTEADQSAAEKWYRWSAEEGCLDAQVALAELLLSQGEKAQKDAWSWLGKACARGFSAAFRVRAKCYEQGTGVSADLSRAVAEYRRAAECSGPGQDDWIEEAYCKGRFGWPGKDVLAWIRARAETGAIWALRLCVGILRADNPSLFDDFLLAAAQKGIAPAQFELARQCLFCNQQIQAREWFTAFLGNPEDKDAHATAFAKTWLGRIPHE